MDSYERLDCYGWGSERMVIGPREGMDQPSPGFATWERVIHGTRYRFIVRPEVPGMPYVAYVAVERFAPSRGAWQEMHRWA